MSETYRVVKSMLQTILNFDRQFVVRCPRWMPINETTRLAGNKTEQNKRQLEKGHLRYE